MNSMENKTVLADVGGFTPAIDTIVEELGFVCAGVFGVVWRYCQMGDGKCTASQSKMASKLGMSVRTIQRCTEKLVSAGYLKSVVIEGLGVEYYDTGLAGLKIQVTGYNNSQPSSSVAQDEQTDLRQFDAPTNLRLNVVPTHDTESYPPTTLSRTKKEVKIDLKETATTTAAESEIGANSEVAEVFKAYESEIGLLTNYVREDVLDAIKQYPKEWIVESIKEAAKNNTRKWSYALAILKSWQVNGYKTDIRQKRIDGPKAYQNTRKAKQEDSEDKLNQFRKLYQEQKQNV